MPDQPTTGLPQTVNSSEPLARYLTQTNHFNRSQGAVTWRAFDPPPNRRFSVFRVDGLNTQQVREIGKQNIVLVPKPRPLYGVGTIKASTARDSNLVVDPDEPPPRHACISGWPEEKQKLKAIQLELAATATLNLYC